MYKLSVTLPSDEALERALADDAYRATVHIDRAVQADLPRATPPVRASPAPLRTAPEPCQLRTTPTPGTGSGSALRSDAASPVWPLDVDDDVDELDDELAALDTADATSSADCGGGGVGRQLDVERQVLPFCSGLPAAELCAGSISFYRYAQPPGVLGLRPPPLRSNLIALLAVPAHLSTADLLMFVGGYLRCILLSSYSLFSWRHPVPPSPSLTRPGTSDTCASCATARGKALTHCSSNSAAWGTPSDSAPISTADGSTRSSRKSPSPSTWRRSSLSLWLRRLFLS